MINSRKIAQIIKKRRKELEISQEKLSLLCGVSIRKISDIETANAETTVGTLERILDVLGLELEIRIKVLDDEI